MRVTGLSGGAKNAVANVGTRPTFNGVKPKLEVHIFDFSGDLYGRRLEVEFVAKLRDESHFSTIKDLVAQMRIDEAEARTVLEQTQRPA